MSQDRSSVSNTSKIYLFEEADIARDTTKSGLALLQRCSFYHMQHFLVFLVLATGLERMLKVILCIHKLDEHGSFPASKEIKKPLHDLLALRDEFLEVGYTASLAHPPIVNEDRQFIAADPLLNELLSILSGFGGGDRYVYLDGVSEPGDADKWFSNRWEKVTRLVVPQQEAIDLIMSRREGELHEVTVRAVVVCLERFVGALTRSVFLTGRGGEARSLATAFWDFRTLMDGELGVRTYDVINA